MVLLVTRNTTITRILDTVRAELVEARMHSPFDKLRANGCALSVWRNYILLMIAVA